MYFASKTFSDSFVDSRFRHLRVGDDIAAVPQRCYAFRNRMLGKDKCFGKIKIGSSVDHPFDDCFIFRVKISVSENFRNDLEAEEGDITVWINSPGGNVFAAAETIRC